MKPRADRQVDDKLSRAGFNSVFGAIAQLVERVLCKHEVVGSRPSGSTIIQSVLDSATAIAENKFPVPGYAGIGKMTS